MIRVLIVDDHQVVRQGLRFLLEQEGDIEVVGECADGPSAIEAVRTLAPTVVLLDLFLPGLDGIGVLAQIKQDRPATEVLMLTSSSDDEHLLAAVRAGALAYVPKTAGVDQLVDSVRAAARGESVLEPRIAARLVREVREVAVRRRPLDQLVDSVRAAARGESVLEPRIAARLVREVREVAVRRRPLDQLTPRELEVLAALAHGRANRQIARALAISEETVKAHVSSILAKLQLSDRTQAAIFGLQQRLVRLDEALDE